MFDAAVRFRLGIAILDTPVAAVEAVAALVGAGLQVEQICLIAIDRVIDLCESIAEKVADGNARIASIFSSNHRMPDDVGGDEIVATSERLFNLFLRTQLTPAGSIVRSQSSRQRWNLEDAIRSGAVAVVTLPKDTRQHQLVTRLLLASSSHSVTTYDLAASEPVA